MVRSRLALGLIIAIAACSQPAPSAAQTTNPPVVSAALESRVRALSNRIQQDPKNVPLRVELAELFRKSGFEGLAFGQMEELDSVLPGSFLKLFSASVLNGDGTFARDYLVYGQEHFPLAPIVLYVDAQGLRYGNRYKQSHEVLNKLFSSGTYIPGMYALAADLALQERNWQEAFDYACQELSHNPQSKEALQYRIWAMNMLGMPMRPESENIAHLYFTKKTSSDMGILYAGDLLAQRRWLDAIEPSLFGIWCHSDNGMQEVNQKNLIKILSHTTDEQLTIAINFFLQKYHPERIVEAMMYLKLGEALEHCGRTIEADRYYNQCLAITPLFSFKTYLNLASLKERQHEYQTAYNYFQKALSLSPSDKEARLKYQRFYLTKWRADERANTKAPADPAGRIKKSLHDLSP